jgi:hypothetical protein
VLSGNGTSADGIKLRYEVNKNGDRAGSPMILTVTELFDNLAKLIPPPRRHRHHYHGVLSANSKYRAEVTRFANKVFMPEEPKPSTINEELKELAPVTEIIKNLSKKSQSWAKLITKVYEVNPLVCEECGEELKLIAFITATESIKKILHHLVQEVEPPTMHQSRGPPDECQDYQVEEEIDQEYDYQYDQSYNE